jgi:WD40 repeat protein
LHVYHGSKLVFSRELRDVLIDQVVLSDDKTVTTFDTSGGTYRHFKTGSGKQLAAGRVGFGTWNFGADLSPDGRYFTYTNGAQNFKVWHVRDGADIDHPDGYIRSEVPNPADIALSSGAHLMATSTNGRIEVGSFARTEQALARPILLTGAGEANPDTLRFISPHELIAATRSSVSLWDLDQLWRLGQEIQTEPRFTCRPCGPGEVVANPSGTRAIQYDESHTSVVNVFDVPGGKKVDDYNKLVHLSELDVVWLDDERLFTWNSRTKIAAIRTGDLLEEIIDSWAAGAEVDTDQMNGPGFHLAVKGGTEHVITLDRAGRLVDFDLQRRAISIRELALNRGEGSSIGMGTSGSVAWSLTPSEYDGPKKETRLIVVETDKGKIISDRILAGHFDRAQVKGDQALLWGTIGSRFTRVSLQDNTAPIVSAVSSNQNTFAIPDLPFVVQDDKGLISLIDIHHMSVIGSFRVPSGVTQWTNFGYASGANMLLAATDAEDADEPSAMRTMHLGYEEWIGSACTAAGRELTREEWKEFTDLDQPSRRC